MTHYSEWLTCSAPGCRRGTVADRRHLENLTAAGGWRCPGHNDWEARRAQA